MTSEEAGDLVEMWREAVRDAERTLVDAHRGLAAAMRHQEEVKARGE